MKNLKIFEEFIPYGEILNESIQIEDLSSLSTYPKSDLKKAEYFILHHTSSRDTGVKKTIEILNKRKLGIQYIIDRQGKIYKTSKGTQAAHILPSKIGPNNGNSIGVEIIANDDSDILDVQCASALKLAQHLHFPLKNIYGHGKVNPEANQTEGVKCKNYINKNWYKNVTQDSSKNSSYSSWKNTGVFSDWLLKLK